MSLTSKTTLTRGEMYSTPLTLQKAKETRDSLAKMLYDHLFKWIVDTINSSLESLDTANHIGILDIFGFENFPVGPSQNLFVSWSRTHFLHATSGQQL
jgi:myosin heavy subunit